MLYYTILVTIGELSAWDLPMRGRRALADNGGTHMSYLKDLFQALDMGSLTEAATRLLGVFLCLTIHETCHGLAAYAMGDPTAKSMHRLSLNPLRHIDWIGLCMMFFCGFGWAKPVPVDPRYFKKPKQGMAVTALAGPVSNLLLALLLLLGTRLIYDFAPYTGVWNGIFRFLFDTAILSIGLGVFNLVPIPPLDGSKVLAAFLPDRAYFQLMRYERYGILLLLLLSFGGVGGGAVSTAIRWVYQLFINLIY